jgi:hypothetical protein
MLHLSLLYLFTLVQLSSSKQLTFHPIAYHLDSSLSPPSSNLLSSIHPPLSPSSLHLSLSTTTRTIARPVRKAPFLREHEGRETEQQVFDRLSPKLREDEEPAWEEVEMEVPDTTDMETIVNLAKMANDAYALPGDPRWSELDGYRLVSVLPLVLLASCRLRLGGLCYGT